MLKLLVFQSVLFAIGQSLSSVNNVDRILRNLNIDEENVSFLDLPSPANLTHILKTEEFDDYLNFWLTKQHSEKQTDHFRTNPGKCIYSYIMYNCLQTRHECTKNQNIQKVLSKIIILF